VGSGKTDCKRGIETGSNAIIVKSVVEIEGLPPATAQDRRKGDSMRGQTMEKGHEREIGGRGAILTTSSYSPAQSMVASLGDFERAAFGSPPPSCRSESDEVNSGDVGRTILQLILLKKGREEKEPLAPLPVTLEIGGGSERSLSPGRA